MVRQMAILCPGYLLLILKVIINLFLVVGFMDKAENDQAEVISKELPASASRLAKRFRSTS